MYTLYQYKKVAANVASKIDSIIWYSWKKIRGKKIEENCWLVGFFMAQSPKKTYCARQKTAINIWVRDKIENAFLDKIYLDGISHPDLVKSNKHNS